MSAARKHVSKHAPANVSLHIERIVLDGGAYTCAQLGQLQASMERELTGLLRAGGLPAHGRTEIALRGHLPVHPLSTVPQTPSQLGRAMARSVYASLNDASLHPAGDATP
jgi:hypothetical protein